MKTPRRLHSETYVAQAGGKVDPITKAIIPALQPATTFERDPDNQFRSGHAYARSDNPTYEAAEELLTRLEGAVASLCFSSGMAAATSVFLALEPGHHVVAPQVMYWALRRWVKEFGITWQVKIDFVDMTDLEAVERAVLPEVTKLVWVETPANPTWAITDIVAVATIAHRAGARLVVDNTVSTPVLTKPLEYGADLVMHSASKYLNGHSDVIAGMLATGLEDGFWARIKRIRNGNGAILGTFEAWLLQRGMRTLHLRVERACRTAQQIARHFDGHPRVAEVLYPGLPGFAGHVVAQAQMSGGFGGMLSIRVAGGEAAAIATAAAVQVWKRATSLGGVESLIEHRFSVEDPESKCPPDLLRLSCGVEHPGDLIADLEQALTAAS